MFKITKAYLESAYMFTRFPFGNSSALVRAMHISFCAEVPGASALASIVLPSVTTAYPHFPPPDLYSSSYL